MTEQPPSDAAARGAQPPAWPYPNGPYPNSPYPNPSGPYPPGGPLDTGPNDVGATWEASVTGWLAGASVALLLSVVLIVLRFGWSTYGYNHPEAYAQWPVGWASALVELVLAAVGAALAAVAVTRSRRRRVGPVVALALAALVLGIALDDAAYAIMVQAQTMLA